VDTKALQPPAVVVDEPSADAFAKRRKLKRSQMVAEALRLLMQRRAG
jgi:hypothetical protein